MLVIARFAVLCFVVPKERVAVLQDGEERKVLAFDAKVPSSARVWNFWVGGKDNFAADREAGEQILEAMPTLRAIAHMSRRFLINVVHDLTAERGTRQYRRHCRPGLSSWYLALRPDRVLWPRIRPSIPTMLWDVCSRFSIRTALR